MPESESPARLGSLVVVGLGIGMGHLSHEAKMAIENCDRVFTVASNSACLHMIRSMNPNTEDLQSCYARGKRRWDTYHEMAARVLSAMREGASVCFALYGHPGVFALPGHLAIETARKEGYRATMQPGISAEDCVFADLCLDPAKCGCYSVEATDLVLQRRIWDRRSILILWQVMVAGVESILTEGESAPLFDQVVGYLGSQYPTDQICILYEASPFPHCRPRIERIPLSELVPAMFHPETTLVIAPPSASHFGCSAD